MKKETASLIRSFAQLLSPTWPIMVCNTCVKDTDQKLGAAGDYAINICDRCHKSITSKTGSTVRVREENSR